jgi:Major Facilitator Superfamily
MLILLTTSLAARVARIDTSVVNLTIKQIGSDVDPSVNALQWVVDIYNMLFAALMLTGGGPAERFGRIFIIGLTLLGSLICAVAPNVATLIAGRAITGLGGRACELPISRSILTLVYGDAQVQASGAVVMGWFRQRPDNRRRRCRTWPVGGRGAPANLLGIAPTIVVLGFGLGLSAANSPGDGIWSRQHGAHDRRDAGGCNAGRWLCDRGWAVLALGHLLGAYAPRATRRHSKRWVLYWPFACSIGTHNDRSPLSPSRRCDELRSRWSTGRQTLLDACGAPARFLRSGSEARPWWRGCCERGSRYQVRHSSASKTYRCRCPTWAKTSNRQRKTPSPSCPSIARALWR